MGRFWEIDARKTLKMQVFLETDENSRTFGWSDDKEDRTIANVTPDGILNEAQKAALPDIVSALARRLAAVGEEASGLSNYYVRKLRHDVLLSECDLRLLEILRQRRGQFRRVWEIGAGVGQLTAMLALDGHQVVAVERGGHRHAAMVEVLDVLQRHDPAARAHVTATRGAFPEMAEGEDVGADAVVVLCCAFTGDQATYSAFEEALGRFALGVIDFTRLFTEPPGGADGRQRAGTFSARYGIPATFVAGYRIPEENKTGDLFTIGRAR